MNRLENRLNNPKAVIIVGSIAVALNVALYFGIFMPRMMPLIEHAYDFGSSIPKAFIGSTFQDFQEIGSRPTANDEVNRKAHFGEGSQPQASSEQASSEQASSEQASSEADFKAQAFSQVTSSSPPETPTSGPDASPPPDSPSGVIPASVTPQSPGSTRSSVVPQPSASAQPSAPSRGAATSQSSASPGSSESGQSSVPSGSSVTPGGSSSSVTPGPPTPPSASGPQYAQ